MKLLEEKILREGNVLPGNVLQVGYLYTVFNSKIFAGEALVTMALIMLTGWLCMKRERLAVRLMVALVLLFTVSITVCVAAAFLNRDPAVFTMEPAFLPGKSVFPQILAISMITPSSQLSGTARK